MVYTMTAVVTGLLIGQILARRVLLERDPFVGVMRRIGAVQTRVEQMEREGY